MGVAGIEGSEGGDFIFPDEFEDFGKTPAEENDLMGGEGEGEFFGWSGGVVFEVGIFFEEVACEMGVGEAVDTAFPSLEVDGEGDALFGVAFLGGWGMLLSDEGQSYLLRLNPT